MPDTRLEETVPPNDRDAEVSVLGSMILDREAIGGVSLLIKSEDYYYDAHRMVYECLLSLYEKGSPVDLVILKDELTRSGALERVGGMEFVIQLAETVPTSANAEHYAVIIRDKAIQRRLIIASTRIIQEARSNPENVGALLDEAEQRIYEISNIGSETTTEPIRDLLKSALRRIDNLQMRGEGLITGLSTGYPPIDEILDGFHPGELIIVAARPGMGKSSLALNIAENIGVKGADENNGVIVFSLEMSREEVAQRILCANARIDGHQLRRGQLSDDDWKELPLAADRLSRAPIFIDDTAALSVAALRAKTRRLMARHEEIKLIIVDYMQLMTADGRQENRQIEITRISQGLKQIAREFKVPVVCLSQLNRALETRADKRPIMADLRESGSIEQDADVICFIYRDDKYNPEPADKNTAELIVAKQRNGPTGKLDFLFFEQFMRFEQKFYVSPGNPPPPAEEGGML